MQQFSFRKNKWLILLLLFSLVSLLGDLLNGRFDMVDFEVYYRTAQRMWNQQDIYNVESDGHFVYKYAPTAALFFLPFLLFSFNIAKYLFWGLLTATLAWLINTVRNLSKSEEHVDQGKSQDLGIIGALLAVAAHIHLEWHLGQVNIILIGLYLGALYAVTRNQENKAGLFLAVSLFIKPFALIFLPYFFIKKKYKVLWVAILTIIVLALLPLLFYPSLASWWTLHEAWIGELKVELASKQNLLVEGNHTIFSVLARYTPIQFLLDSAVAEKTYQLIILIILGLSFLQYMNWGKKLKNAFVGEMLLLIAVIPLLAFTSHNAFIFTLPLIIYLASNYFKMVFLEKIILVLGCLGIGFNMYDIVGPIVFQFLIKKSIYTFGSVLLLLLAFYHRKKEYQIYKRKLL